MQNQSPNLQHAVSQMQQQMQAMQGGQGAHNAGATLLAFAAMVVVALVIALAVSAVVCYLFYIALKRVPDEHRKMAPGLVWLLMIPFFNLIWNFFVLLRIPDSYKSSFDSVGRTDVGDCGRGIGLAAAICVVCGLIPVVGGLAGLAALVLLIIFFVKIFGLRGQIPAEASGQAAAASVGPAPVEANAPPAE